MLPCVLATLALEQMKAPPEAVVPMFAWPVVGLKMYFTVPGTGASSRYAVLALAPVAPTSDIPNAERRWPAAGLVVTTVLPAELTPSTCTRMSFGPTRYESGI